MPSDMEIISEAEKQGIDFAENTPSSKQEDVSAASSGAKETQPKDNVQANDKGFESKVESQLGNQQKPQTPEFDHPRFNKLWKENKTLKNQMDEMKRLYQEQQAYLSQMSKPQIQGLPDEQKNAIIQLAKLMKQVPEFSQELGLDKIRELSEKNEQLEHRYAMTQMNKEKSDVLEYAKKLGLNPEEVEMEVADFIEENELYRNLPATPGSYRAAFRDRYWDELSLLKEKELNLRQIEEKQRLKGGKAEDSSKPVQKSKRRSENDAEDIAALIDEAGGLDQIDFNA